MDRADGAIGAGGGGESAGIGAGATPEAGVRAVERLVLAELARNARPATRARVAPPALLRASKNEEACPT